MERTSQLQTAKEFFSQIARDGKNKMKRDFRADTTTHLAIQRIKPEISFAFDSFADIPTIVAASHIARSFINSGTLITTVDSMTTAATVSLGLFQKTEKPLTWVVLEDIKTKILGVEIPARHAQLAMINTYDFVGLRKDPQMRNALKLFRALSKNVVCLCPEGKIGEELNKYNPMFIRVLDICKRIGDYQIIPVSIWPEESKGTWIARFNEIITPQETSRQTADLTMQRIAQSLPWYLRGKYSGLGK